jgi:hypothetical protein
MKTGRPKRTHCDRGHEFTEENTYVSPSYRHHPNGLRQCLACRKQRGEVYHKKHREKILARSSAWAKANPERIREIGKKSSLCQLGWSIDLYDKVIASQSNTCAVCKVELNTTTTTKAHADHRHVEPPLPRGILCALCNMGIGSMRDNPDILRAAADYLEKF